MNTNFLNQVLALINSIPWGGAVLADVIVISAALSALVTALVGAWTALVMVAETIASLPGLASMKPFADSLKADTAKIESGEKIITKVLSYCSMLPLPQGKK